ncbi:hypothetical protein IEQ34_004604 [Dendrobium chrysotoxum]|uniref:Uncharacterized protein n=1 Tax=Dendrobium chrysotoxum TaxID=161865 RepID=A0AAV7HEF1_DENCH|nr:hypothetical protein IEQ34_004604 [Dendrobium chrysotoxum]
MGTPFISGKRNRTKSPITRDQPEKKKKVAAFISQSMERKTCAIRKVKIMFPLIEHHKPAVLVSRGNISLGIKPQRGPHDHVETDQYDNTYSRVCLQAVRGLQLRHQNVVLIATCLPLIRRTPNPSPLVGAPKEDKSKPSPIPLIRDRQALSSSLDFAKPVSSPVQKTKTPCLASLWVRTIQEETPTSPPPVRKNPRSLSLARSQEPPGEDQKSDLLSVFLWLV